MIGCVQGEIIEKTDNQLLVMTAGGVGYSIWVTDACLQQHQGASIFLYTTLVVREDAMSLFGFETAEEKNIFDALIQVNGVGPKGALAILCLGSINRLRQAISQGDSTYVAGAKRIGSKTAEKVIIELRDKIGTGLTSKEDRVSSSEVMEVLVGLGYDRGTILATLREIDCSLGVEEQIRLALRHLAQR
jgi:Holliday junction DNA helicase RuvA